MGHGASQFGRTDWPSLVGRWLRRAFPAAAHNLRNSAIPASPSEYISFCLQHYLPPEPDLIVVSCCAFPAESFTCCYCGVVTCLAVGRRPLQSSRPLRNA